MSLINKKMPKDLPNKISLRDYLASQALISLYSNTKLMDDIIPYSQPFGKRKTNEEFYAEYCYKIADAMIKVRKNK